MAERADETCLKTTIPIDRHGHCIRRQKLTSTIKKIYRKVTYFKVNLSQKLTYIKKPISKTKLSKKLSQKLIYIKKTYLKN